MYMFKLQPRRRGGLVGLLRRIDPRITIAALTIAILFGLLALSKPRKVCEPQPDQKSCNALEHERGN